MIVQARVIVQARHLTHTYANGFAALGPLDFAVERGEFLTVLGPSGSGKSTLLRVLAGLATPSAGGLHFAAAEREPQIGIVFQEPRLMPWLTVARNVALGLFDLPSKERLRRVPDVLDRVGLAAVGDALPKTLSGGMAQRVGVARALALQPDLLLMDEPFGALDPLTRLKLQHHLADILADQALSVVFVTHDIEEALFLSDRIIVLEGPPGRIRWQGPVAAPRPRHRDSAELRTLRRHLLAQFGLPE